MRVFVAAPAALVLLAAAGAGARAQESCGAECRPLCRGAPGSSETCPPGAVSESGPCASRCEGCPAGVLKGRERREACIDGRAAGLSGEELAELRELAAERPELAEQAGGYLTNEDLVTILLVVLIIVLVI
jgi:hypothetical protein